MSKGNVRLSRVRPGSTLRLEIHLSNFYARTMALSCAGVGELFDMLMDEAAGDPVKPASKPRIQRVFDMRDEYRVIKGGFGRSRLSLATRQAVFERDGRRCGYCGQDIEWENYHCDHVEAAARGGSDDLGNLRASCVPCNLAKAAKPLSEWLH